LKFCTVDAKYAIAYYAGMFRAYGFAALITESIGLLFTFALEDESRYLFTALSAQV